MRAPARSALARRYRRRAMQERGCEACIAAQQAPHQRAATALRGLRTYAVRSPAVRQRRLPLQQAVEAREDVGDLLALGRVEHEVLEPIVEAIAIRLREP